MNKQKRSVVFESDPYCDSVPTLPDFARMEIIDGSFAYAMPAGSCKKKSWVGHYQYIEVLVYATDGVIVGWRYGPLE